MSSDLQIRYLCGPFAAMRYPVLLFVLLMISGAVQGQEQAVAAGKPLLFLRHINITGHKVSRRSIILREMSVQEGMVFRADSSEALLAENRLRLANAALFTTISVQQVQVAPDTVDWEIGVKERWYLIPKPLFQLADRNFNVWWKEQNRDPRRANFGLTLTHANFRGNMERVVATAQVGYTQRFALEYSRPYLDKKQQHGIGFSINVAQSGELFYQTSLNKLQFARIPGNRIIRQYDLAAFYTYRPAFAVRHVVQLAWHEARIADTVRQLNPDYFKNDAQQLQYGELQYRLDLNYTDNWNYPMRGFKMVSYAVARAGITGMDFQGQLRTELGIFHHPLPKWYTAVIFRGRLSFPEDQPYYFRTGLGTKTDYVRGYEYYVMDGAHYGVLRLNLKRELLNKTLFRLPFRYLPSFPLRIYPKLFADVGYMADRYPGNSTLSNKLLYSAGIGVDMLTSYDVKIRVEFAVNHLGENGLFLHLNSE